MRTAVGLGPTTGAATGPVGRRAPADVRWPADGRAGAGTEPDSVSETAGQHLPTRSGTDAPEFTAIGPGEHGPRNGAATGGSGDAPADQQRGGEPRRPRRRMMPGVPRRALSAALADRQAVGRLNKGVLIAVRVGQRAPPVNHPEPQHPHQRRVSHSEKARGQRPGTGGARLRVSTQPGRDRAELTGVVLRQWQARPVFGPLGSCERERKSRTRVRGAADGHRKRECDAGTEPVERSSVPGTVPGYATERGGVRMNVLFTITAPESYQAAYHR